MSAVTDIDISAASYARRLEDREQVRSGACLPVARASIARRVGISAGTLENLRRGRIKGVRAWIAEALRDALVKELKNEIAAHEHELAILLAGARHPDQQAVEEITAGVEALRERLRGCVR